MRTTVLYAGALALAFLLPGCSESGADSPEQPQERVPIHLTGIVQGGVESETKAPVEGGTAETPATTLYFVRADQDATTGVYGAWGTAALPASRAKAVGNTPTSLVFTKTQYYLSSGKKTKLTGWYPAATSFTGGVASWTLTGAEDVMTCPAAEGSKATDDAIGNMAFAHRLSQLQFYVYTEEAEFATLWGKVKGVSVKGQQKTCTYTLGASTGMPDGSVAFSGTADGVFTVYQDATGVDAPVSAVADKATKAKFLGTVMVPVQTSATYELPIDVVTANGGTTTVKLKQALAASTAYKVYLKLTANQIKGTATIGGWATGTAADVEL